ncbi:TonB-dependent receptor [Pseudomaricurvus alkylphenolicus]|uniref:TonB-dependent receptor n=1 Tax=Pseudomaricurvus alkylphenolicus TaxID=1306991 RepID=UPI00141E3A13|nr:TonB-dependent receptor [Pseudomaricurvus alkylphenolicus]NIB38375.1 TonB-dependent receptor [Pseudomaricurvus alkylphenolicus]
MAQTTSVSAFELEEIIVTAQKRETSLQDTPIAISAFSGDGLEELGIENAEDLTRFVPGADFSTNGGAVAITIRGVGSDGLAQPKDDPSVAAHLDGIYLARQASLSAMFYDIERVEVLRGPQGTLYGRNATGGSLNIITKKPSDELEGAIDFSIGNYGTRQVKGMLNTPLVEDKLNLRMSALFNRHDGYSTELNELYNDPDDADEKAYRAKLSWQVSDDLSIDFGASLYESDAVGPNRTAADTTSLIGVTDINGNVYGGVTGAIIFDPAETANALGDSRIATDERTSMSAFEQSMLIESDTYTMEIEWKINEALTLKSLTGYTEFAQDSRDTSLQYVADPLLNATFDYVTESESFTEELNLSYEADNLKVTTGLFYFSDEGTNDFSEVPGDPSHSLTIYSLQEVENESFAAYLEGTYYLNDNLSITTGVRYTDESKEGGSVTDVSLAGPFGFIAPTYELIAEYDEESIDYKIGLEWTPNENILVYASYSTAFKSGGFNTGAPINLTYEPEEIDAIQAGIKSTWLDGHLQANLAAFSYDYQNLQVTQVLGVSLETQNVSDAEITGLELELQAAPTESILLRAFATITDSEYQDAVISDILDIDAFGGNVYGEIDISGNPLRFTPDYTLGISGAYTISAFGGEITSQLNVYWQDDSYARPHGLEVDRIDAYTRTDVSIRYDSGQENYYIEAYGRNLEDETVLSARFVNPTHTVEYKPPRTYGLSVGYNF